MGNLFQELKRRKVFRVAAVYAVVAWLVIQIADVVLPTFNAPQWINQIIIILLLLGFPVAIVLAWAFDVAPDGSVIKSQDTDVPSIPDSSLTANSILIPMMLLAVGFLFIDRYILSAPVPAPEPGPEPQNVVTRSSLVLGYFPGATSTNRTNNDISHDGRFIAYIVRSETGRSLYLRDLSSNRTEVLLADQRNMSNPVFSDDGQYILLSSNNGGIFSYSLETRKIYFEQTEILSGLGRGKAWLSDNTVVFSSNDGSLQKLSLVDGSRDSANIPRVENEVQAWPQVIDQNRIVYTSSRSEDFNEAKILLYDFTNREVTTLVENGFNASILTSGHVVFMRDNNLIAQSIDPDSLIPNGPEVEVVTGIASQSRNWGDANYAVSDNGRLIYSSGSDGNEQVRRYVLRDLDGNELEVNIPSMRWGRLRLSPDGSKILLVGSDQVSSSDIYIYYVSNGVLERRTYSGVDTAIWAPDSNGFIYAENTGEGTRLMHMSISSMEQPELLINTTSRMEPFDTSEDGSLILLTAGLAGAEDVYVLNLSEETRDIVPLVTSPENDTNASLSPDGNWIAYNRNGRINIHPFPNVTESNRREITTTQTEEPRWGPESNILYFHDQGELKQIYLNTENGLTWDQPETVFSDINIAGRSFVYDVTADGKTYLLPLQSDGAEENMLPQLTIIEMVDNWFTELHELARPSSEY